MKPDAVSRIRYMYYIEGKKCIKISRELGMKYQTVNDIINFFTRYAKMYIPQVKEYYPIYLKKCFEKGKVPNIKSDLMQRIYNEEVKRNGSKV